jgi:predicted metal-dependent enzyme (double-stranded beta helix superfamily)
MSISLPQTQVSRPARYDFEAFIADIERIVARDSDPLIIAPQVEAHLRELLRTPDLLTPDQRASDPEHYRANLVAVAPSGKFSITALIWLPGQITAIHDHICWCVVGVYAGLECEQRYHLRAAASGERWLAPCERDQMTPGMTAALVPPEENIHQVRNAGDALAISLHVYGANLNLVPTHSSINECFDHLPVRDDLSGTPVPWRKAATLPECE